MIDVMEQVHMTEAEVTRDFAAVLEKIQQGAEVVVQQDHRPVAVIRPPKRSGRPISECIASTTRACSSPAPSPRGAWDASSKRTPM